MGKPRRNDQDFFSGLLVLLEEALIFNEKAMNKVRTGQPLQNLISELNGNKLYIQQSMDRINIRAKQKARGIV